MRGFAKRGIRYFCQDEGARLAPPRSLLKHGALRGFTLDGHWLRSLYRIPVQTPLRLIARKGSSSWFKYRTGVWGCETPSLPPAKSTAP